MIDSEHSYFIDLSTFKVINTTDNTKTSSFDKVFYSPEYNQICACHYHQEGEDGTFKFHLRDNARELNPFQLSDKALQVLPEQTEDIDERALVLHAVKTHARQYLYRNYHGFNTVTLTV